MGESILNRDMNCHPIKLETILNSIAPWICALMKSIQTRPSFNRNAIMQIIARSHPVVITLESEFSNIIVQFIKKITVIPSLGMRFFSVSLSISFIMQVPSRIHTSLSPSYFKEKSHRFWLVGLLDTLKYSRKPVAFTQRITIPSVIAVVIGAQALYQTHDLNSIATRLTNKAVSLWEVDSTINGKNCSYHRCTILNFLKIKNKCS